MLASALKDAAASVFRSFSGSGYARMDFRVDASGTVYFLEVNFTCSVFYPAGYQGSADYILEYDGVSQADFLQMILAEGLGRHARTQHPFVVRPHKDGHGIFASRALTSGEVVFHGEERPQRVVTREYVERTWNAADRETFYRYAYPVGPEVFILWDLDPSGWAPQNHSCDPNTVFAGLNVVTTRQVAHGEELTLDYGACYDDRMIPFACACGSPQCRGTITGGRRLFAPR